MKFYYRIRNWIANLLGYRQGIVFRDGRPIGVRVGFKLIRHGTVVSSVSQIEHSHSPIDEAAFINSLIGEDEPPKQESRIPDCLGYLPDNSGIKGRIGYLLDKEMNLISLVGDGLPMNAVTAARIMACYNSCSGIPSTSLIYLAILWHGLNERMILIDPLRVIACVEALKDVSTKDIRGVAEGRNFLLVMPPGHSGSPEQMDGIIDALGEFVSGSKDEPQGTLGVISATAEEKIRPNQILEKGEAEGSVRPIKLEPSDFNNDDSVTKMTQEFHEKFPMIVACPCGKGARLKIVDGIQMKHWNEEDDHKITITYECPICGYKGVPEEIAKRQEEPK